MRKSWVWNFVEKNYDYDDYGDGDGATVWIEYDYFEIYNEYLLPFGFYSLIWDGVKFWRISFGFFAISFGKSGRWVYIKDALDYPESVRKRQ